MPKLMGCIKSSAEKEVSNKSIHQENREVSDNIALHLKELEKEGQTKPNQKERVMKIRRQTNEIETRKTIEKINETKSCLF